MDTQVGSGANVAILVPDGVYIYLVSTSSSLLDDESLPSLDLNSFDAARQFQLNFVGNDNPSESGDHTYLSLVL